eukprot:TRINITY_DN22680_c0_g2_i1.p1 TRINITY_DN22680_c0_g2~~TRINITY_DN22680_c0_g2_i1.p1  ORF type:complete len:545 (+),score=92.99 TRINITY_DN22680_c0_g2_i1:96-1730(+)
MRESSKVSAASADDATASGNGSRRGGTRQAEQPRLSQRPKTGSSGGPCSARGGGFSMAPGFAPPAGRRHPSAASAAASNPSAGVSGLGPQALPGSLVGGGSGDASAAGARPTTAGGKAEFGVVSDLPALSVCRLEAREDVLMKMRQHLDDPALAEFTCPICLVLFWQPVRTVCGHAFCERCLLRSVLAQLNMEQPDVSCPLCRHPLHVEDVSLDQALMTRIRLALRDVERAAENSSTRAQSGGAASGGRRRSAGTTGRLHRGAATAPAVRAAAVAATSPLEAATSAALASRPSTARSDLAVASTSVAGAQAPPAAPPQRTPRQAVGSSGAGGLATAPLALRRPATSGAGFSSFLEGLEGFALLSVTGRTAAGSAATAVPGAFAGSGAFGSSLGFSATCALETFGEVDLGSPGDLSTPAPAVWNRVAPPFCGSRPGTSRAPSDGAPRPQTVPENRRGHMQPRQLRAYGRIGGDGCCSSACAAGLALCGGSPRRAGGLPDGSQRDGAPVVDCSPSSAVKEERLVFADCFGEDSKAAATRRSSRRCA